MRQPTLLLLSAVLGGALAARAFPVSGRAWALAPILLYLLAVAAFWSRHRAFLPLALADLACAGWLLSSGANAAAAHSSLLDAAGVGTAPSSTAVVEPGPVVLEGVLRQDATQTPFGASLSIDARAVVGSARARAVSGGIIASVSGNRAVEHAGEWRAGRVLRAPVLLRAPTTHADPGLRDERLTLARRGIDAFGSIKSAALVETREPGSWWEEHAAELRAYARQAIGQAVGRWSQQSAAIVVAILIGDRAGLTSEVERRLQEAGTYHVIAISGGNIAILAGFLLGLGRLLGVRTRLAACATIIVLVAYADLVGGGASVVRATLMAVTYMVALAFDVRGSPIAILGGAACAILLATPLALYDVAFALTFGATLGIVVAAGSLGARLPRRLWARAPVGLLLASAAAELALLPVGAYAFSRVTFAGLLLNFFAIPLMTLAQLAGTFVLPLAALDGRLAACAGYLAHLGASGLVSTAGLVDLMPALTWLVPAPAGGVIALYYAAFVTWFAANKARERRWPAASRVLRGVAVMMLVTSAGSILWCPLGRLRGSRPTGMLRMTVLDVGQADAILVRFPDASTLLVDSGGSRTAGSTFDVGLRVIAPVLWHLDVFRLDRFLLSHGDPDHIGGAASLLRAFRVGEFWEGIDVPRDARLQALHRELDARHVARRELRAGARFDFGGAHVAVWHPPPPDWERQKIRNDDSVVLEVRFRDVSFLLTGDIGTAVERTLAGRYEVGPLCVLKAPHHGSAGSNSPPFLATVHPALAIFTVAATSTGAPALQKVLQRYREAGAQTVVTGLDGAVEVETDGHRVRVKSFSGRELAVRAAKK